MNDLSTTRYGIEWPAGMHSVLVDLTVAKKHRQLRAEHGIEIKDPWEALLSACRQLFTPAQFCISPWTEEHAHDFVMYKDVVTWGCGASSKSNDYGLFALLDWITDPFDTIWVVGSTTMKDLRGRTWEAVARYFATLQNNPLSLTIPGKLDERGLAILNVADPSIPGSVGAKAGIRGVALNEEGRLQGAHLPYVRVLIDELATINNHESLGVDVANLLIGTSGDFRFYGLANPEGWEDVSSQYCIPPKGVEVTVDTGSWMSASGYWVRHHDGMKSPGVVDPAKAKLYPHLMTRAQYDDNLRRVGGNTDSPRIWKMVRGFPAPGATATPTILDPKVATANNCGSAMPEGRWEVLGSVMGVDPAWSEGGDDAVVARPEIVLLYGKPTLDFTGRVYMIPISATSPVPVTQQQRDAVVNLLRQPGAPPMRYVAVDSSGNQGLADDLDMYVGPGCMHVNNSVRASDKPIRAAGDGTPAKDILYDRGTESWTVLAEFCRAGQVRGLPPKAVQALVSRRFATRGKDRVVAHPLRMEAKEDFSIRFKGSPNEADACALAALAAKERFGIMPFGGLPPPDLSQSFPSVAEMERWDPPDMFTNNEGGYEPAFSDMYEES